jgi:hypothetical protein
LIIFAGPEAWTNRAILSRRALVYVGLVSYPLYLWHWPLLSFLHITELDGPSRSLRAVAVTLAFILASLTYELVERPIRKRAGRRTPFRMAAIAGALAIIAATSAYSYVTEAFAPRVPNFATMVDPTPVGIRDNPACHRRFAVESEYCQESAPNLPVTTALLGDSHAEHYLVGVGASLSKKHENVVHLGVSGCPPLLDIERPSASFGSRDTCRDADNAIIRYVAAHAEITRVLLAFRGTTDVTGVGFGDAERGLWVKYRDASADLPQAETIKRALQRTVEFLLSQGKSVWVMLQVPELGFEPGTCVGRPFSFSGTVRSPCAVPVSVVRERQAGYRAMVAEVKQQQPALQVFDPLPFMCDARWCYGMVGGQPVYHDNNHLGRAGSLMLADKFAF